LDIGGHAEEDVMPTRSEHFRREIENWVAQMLPDFPPEIRTEAFARARVLAGENPTIATVGRHLETQAFLCCVIQ